MNGRGHVITEWNHRTLAQLNDTLEQLWSITNGGYIPNTVTTNPDGSRVGEEGEVIVYNNSGSRKFCQNTDGGTTWVCNANALTTP